MHTKILAITTTALMVTGCSMAPEMKTPGLELPKSLDNASHVSSKVDMAWWENFHDKNLNLLIEEALKNNDDLKLAVVNVQKARAQYGISEAEMYPQIDLGGSATRQRKSSQAYPSNFGGMYNDYGFSVSAAYELDFWGKVRNQKNADFSSLLATDADKEALRISLIVDVATYYFNLVSLNEQLKIANESLQSYKKSLQYRESQLKYGVVDALVVAQAKALVANANTLVQTIESSKLTTQSALALLLGRTPKEIFEKVTLTSNKLPKSVVIPAGLPASLLENRPDIKAAEDNLKSKTALIGVARAAYFPSISLTGNYGFQSQNLDNLMNNSSQVWGFGPSLNLPLFHFGAIKSAIAVSESEQKAALISYDKAVKTAYKEVYESLGKIRISKLKCRSVAEEVDANTQAYKLANIKFDRGSTSYLDVLTAQKALLTAQLSSVSANMQLLIDEVTLYKSLGGGWNRAYNSAKK